MAGRLPVLMILIFAVDITNAKSVEDTVLVHSHYALARTAEIKRKRLSPDSR